MASSARKGPLFLLAVLVLVAGLTTTGSAAEHPVQIVGVAFQPQNITIPAGDTIRWINNSGLFHTSTSGTNCTADGLWSAALLDGQEFALQFDDVGSFPYFCVPHCGALMTGTITVEATVPVEQATWGGIKALYSAGPKP